MGNIALNVDKRGIVENTKEQVICAHILNMDYAQLFVKRRWM